jgi:hypothetical protein
LTKRPKAGKSQNVKSKYFNDRLPSLNLNFKTSPSKNFVSGKTKKALVPSGGAGASGCTRK